MCADSWQRLSQPRSEVSTDEIYWALRPLCYTQSLRMFIEAVQSRLREVEADDAVNTFPSAVRALRSLGLDDFGYVFMSMPNGNLPKLSKLLPRMASEEVQRSWTGSSGVTLLRQTCAFARSVAYHYTKFTGRPLEGASILDYGCGYGRVARLMYYFSDPSKVVGLDPWDKSIAICKQDGLGDNFLQSDYLPESLPVGTRRFDLIYAFSVFTHLSERAARASLSTLARYLERDGLLVITIRPVEYWHHDPAAQKAGAVERQMALHREKGFSFLPHQRAAVDGDITYGDTSLTTQWLSDNFSEFSIKGVDRSLDDSFQYYVFLQRSAQPPDWTPDWLRRIVGSQRHS
jgi:SAM-dependent methyltransferase